MTKRDLVVLALVFGVLTASVLWMVKSFQTAGLGPAPVQPDSMVYFQYGKAIVDGHAYRYTSGQEATTGSTSHLYPFVLSLLIHVAGQDRLETASFILNAVGHTLSLLLVTLIAWRLRPRAAPVALLLAALSGHLMMTVNSDCDMSLFVPLALGTFYAAVCGRPSWTGIALALAPWTRPEGLILALALTGAAAAGLLLCPDARRDFRRFVIAGSAGIVSGLLVFVWNHHLTGQFGFDSTAHKSWFDQFPWTGALMRASQDFMAVWSGAFWGTGGGVRAMLGVPLLGAALFVAGFAAKPRESAVQTAMQNGWLAGVVLATGMVAVSGWAGAVFDRYLGWITPLVAIYAAIGLVAIADALKNRALLLGGAAALAVLQASGAAYFLGLYGASCADTAAAAAFARDALHAKPHEGKHGEDCDHQQVLTVGEAGLACYLDASDVVNLNAIVSPHMGFARSPLENIERLKHWHWRRAPLLLLTDAQAREPWLAPLVGAPVALQDPSSLRESPLGIYKADYSVFDRAGLRPLRPDIAQLVAGMTNVCNIEVGFGAVEAKLGRYVSGRAGSIVPELFAATRFIGTNRVMEIGEVVLGSESFTITTLPGRPLRGVLRTASSAAVPIACADGTSRTRTFEFGSPLRLEVTCGGKTFKMERKIDPDANAFDEITFELPAAVITGKQTEITVAGDHIACAWWFFQ